MTTIILFFSIIINLFAILAIVILYLRQNHLINNEKNQKQTLKEMEDIFSSYIEEMKEENEQFISKMENLRSNQKNDQREANVKPIFGEVDNQKIDNVTHDTYTRMYAAKSYQNNLENTIDKMKTGNDSHQKDDENTNNDNLAPALTFEEQVIFLHDKGLTIDEIAQNLKKGKTEIELLLRFRQKH